MSVVILEKKQRPALRRALCALAATSLALWVTGCEPEPPPGPLSVELGLGDLPVFMPLGAGSSLQLHRGAQGGQHVYFSLRVYGLPEDESLVRASLIRVQDGESLAFPLTQSLTFERSELAPDAHERTRLPLVVDSPEAGTTVRLEVEVEDADGRRSQASHEGLLEWAP